MYCGNLAVFNNSRSNTITILGNNHTLTLKPSFTNIFYTPFKIENLNINLEVPYGILPGYHYHGGCDTLDYSSNIFIAEQEVHVLCMEIQRLLFREQEEE